MSEEQQAAGVIGAALGQRIVACANGGAAKYDELASQFMMDPQVDAHDEGRALLFAERARMHLHGCADAKKVAPPRAESPSLKGREMMMLDATVREGKWVPGSGAHALIMVLDKDSSPGLDGIARRSLLEVLAPIRRRLGL